MESYTPMGTWQKRLWREMNDYAKLTGSDEFYTPKYVQDHYTEAEAKELVETHTLKFMLSDFVEAKKMAKARKKKPVKTKSKRKIKKKKDCGCV